MVCSCLSILKLIITIKFPAIVTTLSNPADIPIRVACHGVYPVTAVAFEEIVEQLCSFEHGRDDIDGIDEDDVISGIDDGDERRIWLFF